MRPVCLASSSQGNCFIFEFDIKGTPTRIMVECGVPMSDIYKGLNENGIPIESIKACLITHAHNDHCRSAIALQGLGIPIFAHKLTLNALKIVGEELIQLQPKRVCNGIYVMAFEVEHDIDGAVGFISISGSGV